MPRLRRTVTRADIHFWFLWVVANAVGMTVGMSIRQFLLRVYDGTGNLIVVGAIVGLALGVAQLRPVNWSWIAFSIIGWAIGWSVGWSFGWSLFQGTGLRTVFTLIGGLAGVLSGSLQWFILRHRSPRAGWWVLASMVGWAVGMAVGTSLGGALGWPVVGLVSGAITGIVLRWVL